MSDREEFMVAGSHLNRSRDTKILMNVNVDMKVGTHAAVDSAGKVVTNEVGGTGTLNAESNVVGKAGKDSKEYTAVAAKIATMNSNQRTTEDAVVDGRKVGADATEADAEAHGRFQQKASATYDVDDQASPKMDGHL